MVPVAGTGAGIMPLIRLGLLNGKKAVGNRTVDYMLRKVAVYSAGSVAVDGNIITGRDTFATPAAVSALCKIFDPGFVDKHKGVLKGKKVMVMIAEDWEDIELCAPTLELMYRGAEIIVGLFDPIQKARPAMLDSAVRTGSCQAGSCCRPRPGCARSSASAAASCGKPSGCWHPRGWWRSGRVTGRSCGAQRSMSPWRRSATTS